MSDETKFRTFLEWASAEVAKWPEWKRNVLGGIRWPQPVAEQETAYGVTVGEVLSCPRPMTEEDL